MSCSHNNSTYSDKVCEGDQIILKKNSVLKVFNVIRNRTVFFEKTKILLDGLIGESWGSVFDASGGKLVKISRNSLKEGADKDQVAVKDNRDLLDAGDNQKLTRDEINSMKDQGVSGEKIVENLIENSATFDKKTEFAQQKYIKKKKKKHGSVFCVLKPNTRLLAQMYYNRGPLKICNLRMDSISQILTYGNVHAGCNLMVVESCNGLVIGAVMDRMQGIGNIVHFYHGSAPGRQAYENFNFPSKFNDSLYSFPLDKLNTLVDSSNTSQKETAEDSTTTHKQESQISHDAASNNDVNDTPINQSSDSNEESNNKEINDTDDPMVGKSNSKREHEDREQRKQVREEALRKTREFILQQKMDGLIVATKFYPTPVVINLLKFVMPSRPIVIFCQYKEPLLDCYMQLRDQGTVLSLRLTETWLRNYQILPNRSHPEINMSGSGGYLLTGITVEDS